jgi:hypothetical protein
VTFRLQGPIKRSTFQRETPDPVEESLGDVLHWSWSTRMQAARLRQSVSAELIAWNREGRHRTRHAFSKTSCDELLLLVCAANLDRALEKLPKQFRRCILVPKPWRRGLWLLRNVYEHWDELRRHLRAGTDDAKGTVGKLRREFPSADPWSFTIDPESDEVILASVVPLKPLMRELRRLEARILRLERKHKSEKTQDFSQIQNNSQL